MTGRGDSDLSEGRGRGEESLPVFDADERIDLPPTIRFGPAGPRGLGPARGAGIAAGLLVLLVAGIAVGSLPKAGDPTVRSSLSGEAGDDAIAVTPTTRTGRCEPQSMARYPMLSLSVTGVPYAVDATLGSGYHVGEKPITDGTWVVPPLSRSLYLPQPQSLDLTADLDACLKRLVIVETETATVPNLVNAKLLYDGTFDPPVRVVTFGGIEAGDRVLRVEAHYDTQETRVVPELVTFSYLRVIAGGHPVVTDTPALTPGPSPRATPSLPCGAATATSDIVVTLSGGTGDPVAGIADVVPVAGPEVLPIIPYVSAVLGESVKLDIAGAACAVSWEIRLMDPYSGLGGYVSATTNPDDDPTLAAQNHWEIPIISEQLVIASLHFAGGPTITRTWHVVPASFMMPAAFLIAPDGARFEASVGCGLTLRLENGYASSESCETTGYFPGEGALQVGAYSPLRFEIPGWRTMFWSAGCGTIVDGTDTWNDDMGCDLGGGHPNEDGGALLDPVEFIARPGDLVIRVFIIAVAPNGDQFEGTYFARVVAR